MFLQFCGRFICPRAVTPQDYQPPGFKDSEGDTMEFEREPVKLSMGQVMTPFHTLKLDMATERLRLEQVNENSLQARGIAKALKGS